MDKHIKVIFTVILFLVFSSQVYSAQFLLHAPPSITEEEKLSVKQTPLSMTFLGPSEDKNTTYMLNFSHLYEQTFLVVQLQGAWPNVLETTLQTKFKKREEGELLLWTFVHPMPADEVFKSFCGPWPLLDAAMGKYHSSLVIDPSIPETINCTQLTQLTSAKHIVFYTGAGISATAVPTMEKVLHGIGLDKKSKEEFFDIIKKAIEPPHKPFTFMKQFFQDCLNAHPTLAHIAITQMCRRHGWGLMTENLDNLHQQTGVKPLNHLMEDWLHANVSAEDLKKIDFIIAVGLAADESGFLAYYKQHSPTGRIIAINLNQPNYLGREDFFLQGDAQEILPLFNAKAASL